MLPLRCLLVGFDGLRPDLVAPDLTPNLCRLQAEGVTFARHVTVYPSETRVVFPSLVTGATADRHGMIGNRYLDRSPSPPRYVDTADAALLEVLDAETDGNLMTTGSLGELLHGAGRSLAVLASNSRGATRCLNHKARLLGQLCLSGHFADVATPEDRAAGILADLGPLPPAAEPGTPDLEAQTVITTAFLDHVWPRHRPDVTLLWYSEPDLSAHFSGVGAPETRQAIAHADAQFGRILDWWLAEGRQQGVQLFAQSDHGHLTAHTKVSVAETLGDAGFRVAAAPAPDVDAVVVPGHVGAIYLTDPTEDRLRKAGEAIMEAPWCGPVFTKGRNRVDGIVPGTLATGLVMADHTRAPDIYFSFRADDRTDSFGLVGGTFYDNDRRPGLGLHGGLHPKELACLSIAAGSAFKSRTTSRTPCGVPDIAPTMLHLLGLPRPPSMTGRLLAEALVETGEPPAAAPEAEDFEAGFKDYRQTLRRVRYGGATYLAAGWVGSAMPNHMAIDGAADRAAGAA